MAPKTKGNGGGRWNKVDDAKLAELFRKGILDPRKTDSKSIHIALKHWPGKAYNSFASTFRRKAQEWNLAKDLAGARSEHGGKRDNAGRKKAVTIHDFQDDDDESGDDFVPDDNEEEEQDIDLEPSEEEDEEQEDSKPAAFETPKLAAKKKAIKKVKEDLSTEELSNQLSKMSIASSDPYCMNLVAPYIMYDYVEYGKKIVSVDFLVPNQHRRFFRLNVLNNKQLELVVVLPNVFVDPNRMLNQNSGKKKHHKNTHKQTAFAQACKKVMKEAAVEVEGAGEDDDDEPVMEIRSKAQLIELPFTVETQLYRGKSGKGKGYNVLVVENEDETLFSELGDTETDFFILSVDMESNEKAPPKKARGAMQKIKSPTRNLQELSSSSDEEMEEEEEGDGQ